MNKSRQIVYGLVVPPSPADNPVAEQATCVPLLLAAQLAALSADLADVGSGLRQSDALLAEKLDAGAAPPANPVGTSLLAQAGVLQALQAHDRVTQVIEQAVRRLALIESILRLPAGDEAVAANGLHSLLAMLEKESNHGPSRHDGQQGGSVDLFN